MRSMLKALARAVLGEYGLYQVWALGLEESASGATGSGADVTVREIGRADVEAATEAALRESAWYLGDGSHGFGCFAGAELVGLAFYWHADRYRRRHSVSIGSHDAKLVHIVTTPAMRGRGIAAMLIDRSAVAMRARGFQTLYARIWHSNRPSLHAFARAGWRPKGWLLQVNPLRRRAPWTFYLRR